MSGALAATWIATLSFAAEVPPLVIRLTDSWQSRMLHAELTRDWTRTVEGRKPKLAIFNHYQKCHRFILVVDRGRVGLPQYRWKTQRDWNDYDRRAFWCTTWPLMYTVWLVSHKRWEQELYEWNMLYGNQWFWQSPSQWTFSEMQHDLPDYDYGSYEEPPKDDSPFYGVGHPLEPMWDKPIEPIPPWHPTARRALQSLIE